MTAINNRRMIIWYYNHKMRNLNLEEMECKTILGSYFGIIFGVYENANGHQSENRCPYGTRVNTSGKRWYLKGSNYGHVNCTEEYSYTYNVLVA